MANAYGGLVCNCQVCQYCGEIYLQALQFQETSIRHTLQSGTEMNNYWPNYGFIKNNSNISAQALTF
jgi:hypothetical protein